jgi:hypothetical protein
VLPATKKLVFVGCATPPFGSSVTARPLISVASGRFSMEIEATPDGVASKTPALCGFG